jgi:hypothetical protein
VNEIAGDINVMLKRKIKIVKVVYLLNFFRIISENTRPNEIYILQDNRQHGI